MLDRGLLLLLQFARIVMLERFQPLRVLLRSLHVQYAKLECMHQLDQVRVARVTPVLGQQLFKHHRPVCVLSAMLVRISRLQALRDVNCV